MDKKFIRNEEELKAFHKEETHLTYSDDWKYFEKPEKYPCIICFTENILPNARKDEFKYIYIYDYDIFGE